ncbi:MAG: Gfo/Idh/MocA family oxidoreductase [Candidatus Latescibacteria bacterium]|nr:Gfo/Idh/MocA family oxidoreductase [Candidatus Latescibacterota bacterium]
MAEPVRLAMIGCGGMAGGHLRAYQTLKTRGIGNFELAAVCDTVEERARGFARTIREFQGKSPNVYTAVEMMLKQESLTAADIATPHCYHHASALPCLESGVDVIIEKPLGITVKASRKIIETAEQHGRIVATAENIRRYLGQRTIHWVLNERKMIGTPRLFFVQHASWSPSSLSSGAMQWRVQKRMSGGWMVMDSGAHYMDSIRYFFGDVDRVYAEVRAFEPKEYTDASGQTVCGDVEDSWTATLTFKSGLIGTWSWSQAAPGKGFNHVLYYGSEGSIEDTGDVFHGFMSGNPEVQLKEGSVKYLNDLKIEFLLSLDAGRKEQLFPHGITDGVVLECYDFIDAVAHRRRPEVDGWDGLRAKAISEAIYESSWCGQAVSVDEVVAGKVEGYQKDINEYWKL